MAPLPAAFLQAGKGFAPCPVAQPRHRENAALYVGLFIEAPLQFLVCAAATDFGPPAGGVLEALHDPVHLGAAGLVPYHVDVVANQPERKWRRRVVRRRAKRLPVVHPEAARLVAPLKYPAQGFLHFRGGHLVHLLVGGKRRPQAMPRSSRPRWLGSRPGCRRPR